MSGCLLGSIVSSACIMRPGHDYWAWNDSGFSSQTLCSAIPGDGVARLRVVVRDPTGAAVAGSTVRIGVSGGPSESFTTDVHGEAAIPVQPGHCHIDVEFLGFRPAHYDLEIPPGKQCDVTFGLDLLGSDVPTVAEHVRAADSLIAVGSSLAAHALPGRRLGLHYAGVSSA
jgi:hypothetical protein